MKLTTLLRTTALAGLVAGGLFTVAGPSARSAAAQSATTIRWDANATDYRGQTGRQLTFACPAGGTLGATVWGTDVYTDDSAICVAAVHAGRITTAGGAVTIELRPGQPAYAGSTRNGVATREYGGWGGSFVFVAAGTTPPPVRTPVPPSGERLLGGLNVRAYCAGYFAEVVVGTDGVWYCTYADVFGYTISFDPDLTEVCQWQYSRLDAVARQTRPGDPQGWGCFVRG